MEKSAHNYGIDLVKIVAMFLIVLLHVLGQGGVLENCVAFSAPYRAAWLLETAAFVSVDCYALASGYLLYNHPFKPLRYVSLWLQVVFYTVLITFIFSKVQPQRVGAAQWRAALLPVVHNQYWYFTAYTGAFFLMPFICRGVACAERRETRGALAGLFVFFSVLPPVAQTSVVGLNSGYSVLLLVLFAAAGAYIKKYEAVRKPHVLLCLAVYVLCTVCAWQCRLWSVKTAGAEFGLHLPPEYFVSFMSPFVTVGAIAFFVALVRLPYPGRIGAAVISFFSATSFSVYLIHVNPLIWDAVMKGRYAAFAHLPGSQLALRAAGAAAAVWLFCSAVDLPRLILFRETGKVIQRIFSHHTV